AGGLVAAPIAAWLVRHMPPRVLGSPDGGVILLTNIRTLLRSDRVDAADPVRDNVYAVIAPTRVAAVGHSAGQALAPDRLTPPPEASDTHATARAADEPAGA